MVRRGSSRGGGGHGGDHGSDRGGRGGGRGHHGGRGSGRGGRGRHKRRIYRGGMHGSQAGAYTGYHSETGGHESQYYFPKGIGGAGGDLEEAMEGFEFPHPAGEKDDEIINTIELMTNESDG